MEGRLKLRLQSIQEKKNTSETSPEFGLDKEAAATYPTLLDGLPNLLLVVVYGGRIHSSVSHPKV